MDQDEVSERLKDMDMQKDVSTTKEQGDSSVRTATPQAQADKFLPYDLSSAPLIPSGLPPEIWSLVQSAPAQFPPQYFLDVCRNLLENPNLTAPHLARAELSYQSFTDATFNPKATNPSELAGIIKHLRPECRPQLPEHGLDGYELEWTVVRKLIPRNPKLDEALMQTCHLYTSHQDITITTSSGQTETVQAERYLVLYIPHVSTPTAIPFYHPKVRSLAISYAFIPTHDASTSVLTAPGTLSNYYSLFPTYPLDNRLERTALKLLEIIHKHSRGRQLGYKKRVHHDQIIGQKRFQDTYAYLKGKYAKPLIDAWVEQTPPDKHVFEDLGIAAFLMELWVDMYGGDAATESSSPPQVDASSTTDAQHAPQASQRTQAQANFPGFVDLGCGNGVLVYILNAEGWSGWGFDARRRKTWSTFPASIAANLHEQLLVPAVLQPPDHANNDDDNKATPRHRNGIFPPGTFLISNHADELTPWAPLLAHLSSSPFIAIPCCSHDLGGARFRAPVHAKYVTLDPNEVSAKKNKQPSAYASLCSWVCSLTERAGYVVEKEVLRIPSTRNVAVLGRRREGGGEGEESVDARLEFLRGLVEREVGGDTTIEQVWRMWMRSGGGLLKPEKGGH